MDTDMGMVMVITVRNITMVMVTVIIHELSLSLTQAMDEEVAVVAKYLEAMKKEKRRRKER